MEKREIWLDYLRAFACILVSLGHLFMSFQESAIKDSTLIACFVQTIYHFHVYIFFFCSGYLFQKSFTKYTVKRTYFSKKAVKCLDYIIVYILFSGVTYFIKAILSTDVNSPIEHTFLEVLLKNPINQMWYMYAIAIVTLCTPVIRTDRVCAIALLIALCLKIVICIPSCAEIIPIPLNFLFANQIWFLLGGIWEYKRVNLNKWRAISFAVFFFAMSVVEYAYDISHNALSAVLTFTGVVASAELFRWATKDKEKMSLIWKLISKYMLQIYLLHTICAAGIRIILLRLGIMNFIIHLVMGILFSFAVPIVCAAVAERTKILNIVFYPTKTVRKLKK